MKTRLFAGLFSALLVFGILLPLDRDEVRSRTPAAALDENCFSLVKSFFSQPESRTSKFFSLLPGVKKNTPFDFDKFKELKQTYVGRLASESSDEIEMERSPEGLLAFAEAVNRRNHIELGPNLEQLSAGKLRSIQKVSDNLLNGKAMTVDDLERSVSELYALILGSTFKFKDAVGEAGKRRMMFRIFAEDLTSKGLLNTLKKYKAFKEPSKYQRVMKFFETKKGKAMLSGLFNLPVIWGMPPFYLPGLKRIRIPDELAKEAVLKGMSDEMVDKMLVAINKDLAGAGTLKLETRAKYLLFRKYYMYGIAGITIYIMYSDFQMAEQYRVENEVYEEALEEASETINNLEVLEERGFNLFEEPEEPEIGTLSNSFCRAIEDCLNSEVDENGARPSEGGESYKACKAFMDPENKCPKY